MIIRCSIDSWGLKSCIQSYHVIDREISWRRTSEAKWSSRGCSGIDIESALSPLQSNDIGSNPGISFKKLNADVALKQFRSWTKIRILSLREIFSFEEFFVEINSKKPYMVKYSQNACRIWNHTFFKVLGSSFFATES